jgi:hypothetical protein
VYSSFPSRFPVFISIISFSWVETLGISVWSIYQ